MSDTATTKHQSDKVNRLGYNIVKLLKVVFAVLLLYWLFSQQKLNINQVKLFLSPLRLSLCFSFILVATVIGGLRWWTLLNAQGFLLKFTESLRFYFIGLFFNFVLPGSVGGDVIKSYYIAKKYSGRKVDSAMTVFVDRIVGLVAMVTMALIVSLMNFHRMVSNVQLLTLFYMLLAVFGGSLILLFVSLSDKFHFSEFSAKYSEKNLLIRIFFKVYSGFKTYRGKGLSLVKAFVLSLVFHTIVFSLFSYVSYVLGENLSWESIIFIVCLGGVASAIPLTPAGVGVGQMAFLYLTKVYTGHEWKTGIIGVTVFQFVMLLCSLIGLYYYIQQGKPVEEIINN